ncbi:uncharacterized protein LOC127834780 isoform X2 [Dreissena polymorpha]|nr:uncharacterized protein LOC127834780 isoform X2 [Dreissena polymorpha]XP_052216775.1 uncharacterized protein LOC127834780 isoform X2 [Dreissena polymorpha]XP_052216776.1 uncharacterized protein LOC127834780 isoform X2 [Dreissena polymorpha]
MKEYNPYCVLRFGHNRVRKKGSRKTHTSYFTGKAECKFRGCTKYSFCIIKDPKAGKRVKMKVRVSGKIAHPEDVIHGRHIGGEQRNNLKEILKKKGPAETFYDNIGNADRVSLANGNFNYVPSKTALRMMLQKVINSEILDRDVFREVDVINDTSEQMMPAGYVQYFAKKPLNIILFTNTQIKMYTKAVKSGNLHLYLDATGSVIDKVPYQRTRLLYYAIVIEGAGNNPPIPVAEFISYRHIVSDISNFLSRFQYAAQKVSQKYNNPKIVEVDFSWALIHSVCQTFNRFSTNIYMEKVWEGSHTPMCTVHICSAHLLHAAKTFVKTKPKYLKPLLMGSLARLIQCKTVNEIGLNIHGHVQSAFE